jgi:hypothetical protein
MDRELAGEDGERAEGVIFDSGTPEMTAAEIKGYLKAMRQVIAQPAPSTPPHQAPVFAGLKGLVEINRELAKGASGNPLIVDNAEMLKAQSIARITGEASATPQAAPAQARPATPMADEASPATVPSPVAKAHEAEGGVQQQVVPLVEQRQVHHRGPALVKRAPHASGGLVEEIDQVLAALLCAA